MALNKLNTVQRASLGLLVIIAVGAGVAVDMSKNSPIKHQPAPKSNIKQLPAQPATNNGEKNIAANTPSTSVDGNPTDKHGASTSSTDRSQWVTSDSKVITVKSPSAQSTLKSGFELSGAAAVGKVQYRLIDDNAGVISQGFIDVVGGNFAAAVNFQSKGSTGRLDVYSSDSNDREINEIQLAVKF